MPSLGAFAITRTTLAAATSTAIRAPRDSRRVWIGNATPDDLSVYSTLDDDKTYARITSGYSDEFDLKTTSFLRGEIAFWVKSVQAGDVVVKWL